MVETFEGMPVFRGLSAAASLKLQRLAILAMT